LAVLIAIPQTKTSNPLRTLLLATMTALLVGLAGCSSVPMDTSETGDSASDLPAWQGGELARLDDGSHHPAIKALLSRAQQAREAGQWSKVMSYLDQARQIEPRNAGIYYRQGWTSLQMGQPAQAEQLLRRGLLFTSDAALKQRINSLLAQAQRQQ